MRDARRFTRRSWLMGAAALTASACDSSRPHAGFLGAMERFNLHFQRALFNPNRLAPELPPEAATPTGAFPKYFVSSTLPVAPDSWALQVGGLVARPMVLTPDDLRLMPRTEYRIQIGRASCRERV